MSRKGEDLPELVFRYQEDGSPAWHCATCGEIVHEQVDGASLFWAVKAQKEHVCPHELARKRLSIDRIRLREVLDELGVRIELHWSGYQDAELMLVDKKTNQHLLLGSETLG